MRARRGLLAGWVTVAAYVGLLVVVSLQATTAPIPPRPPATEARAAARFATAWEHSRRGTYVATGVYERHSELTPARLESEDVVAQRPPRRLHRQLGGVVGREDDRLLVCPAPPEGAADHPAPCRVGPPSGISYDQSVRRDVDGVRSLTSGSRPLYRVRETEPGCFSLALLRVEPRAPYGVRALFCFDAATGAVRSSTVHYEAGIVEVLSVASVRSLVTDADLEP